MNTSILSRRAAGLLVALTLFALTAPASAGWLGDRLKGNGKVVSQSRSVAAFTGIALGIPAQVELKLGTVEGVTIETDENLLPAVETSVKDGVLRILPAKRDQQLDFKVMRITVQAKQVDSLALGGGGSIHADQLRGKALDLEVGGSGTIDIARAEAEKIALSIGGSGKVKLAGAGRKLAVSIGGSGDVAAGGFQADEVDVSIGGSGDAVVWVKSTLSVAVAGSGDVQYWGDAKVQSAIAGSGRVKRLGAAPQ